MHQAVKYSSLLSYMLKPTSLLTKGVNYNNKSEGNLFNHMFNFEAQVVRRNRRRSISSYFGVDTINDQKHMLNPTPLNHSAGYIL